MGQTLAEIIQGMLNNVQQMINQPGNAYYLPTWIQTNGYDPYGKTQSMQWSVSLNDPHIINVADSICPTIDITSSPCPGNDTFIGADLPPTLVLGNNQPGGLLIAGTSNAYLQSMLCNAQNPYSIAAVIQISTLPNYAKNVVISGDFTFTQFCCCSADSKTCSASPSPQVGTGTFTATINSGPTVGVNFLITNLAPNVLTIAVQSCSFTVPSTNGVPNISVTIDITSIPKGANRQSYNNMAMQAFNSQGGLQNIVTQINQILNDPSQLTFIGNVLTNVIDGYLRDNHQYPFDGSSVAL